MDFKTVPFEIKSTSETGSEFDGIANAFHNIDSAQEIVATGSFTDTIPQFLENGFIGNINHQWDTPLGKPISAVEQPKGLFVQGKISNTSYGKDCMILLKDRVIKKLSIGYRVLGDTILADAEEVAAYWKDAGYSPSPQDIARSQHGARLLTKLHLYEFSPVTVPSNSMADITRVKRYTASDTTAEQEIEDFLRDARGFSQKAAKIVVSGLKALYQRDVEEAQTPEPDAQAEKSAAAPEPTEPEPEIEAKAEETDAKQEPEPNEVPAPVVVDVGAALLQSQVQALYADIQRTQARLGLR